MARPSKRRDGTFEERCRAEADRRQAAAMLLPPGPERDQALKSAREMREASNIEKWLSSPGLKPPA